MTTPRRPGRVELKEHRPPKAFSESLRVPWCVHPAVCRGRQVSDGFLLHFLHPSSAHSAFHVPRSSSWVIQCFSPFSPSCAARLIAVFIAICTTLGLFDALSCSHLFTIFTCAYGRSCHQSRFLSLCASWLVYTGVHDTASCRCELRCRWLRFTCYPRLSSHRTYPSYIILGRYTFNRNPPLVRIEHLCCFSRFSVARSDSHRIPSSHTSLYKVYHHHCQHIPCLYHRINNPNQKFHSLLYYCITVTTSHEIPNPQSQSQSQRSNHSSRHVNQN